MGGVAEVSRRHRPAARGLGGGWFGNGPDVSGDERKRSFGAVIDIGPDDHEVRVVAELRVVGDVGPDRSRITTPATCEVTRIRRLRPSEKEVVVGQAGIEGDRRIEPAVALRVPLDLGITGREAGWHRGEGPEVGRAQEGQVAPVVHPDHLIHKLQVPGGADGARGIGWCRLVSLVRGGKSWTVQPVVKRGR